LNVGNPWYRGRDGNVQGRSGGTSDGKADSNPSGSNPPASVDKPATGGSTSK